MIRNTLETRWFFEHPPIARADLPPGEISASRTDWYVCPSHSGNGIKFRDGNFETKLLIDNLGLQELAGTQALVQTWQKWSVALAGESPPAADVLSQTGWVPVTKHRNMWCFEVESGEPRQVRNRVANGCEFEWTEVEVHDRRWWTLGFEAIGTPESLNTNLELVACQILGDHSREPFSAERSMGYPAWLTSIAGH